MNNRYRFLIVSLFLLSGACSSVPPATQPKAASQQIPVAASTPGNASKTPITATRTSVPTIKTLVPTSPACFELLTPESNARVPATGKISFTWQAVPNAIRYFLEITMPNGNIASFKTGDTKINRYAESTAMGGTYQWKVIAYDASGELLCTAGPSSYSKPETSKPEKECRAEEGCTNWDPVACVCR